MKAFVFPGQGAQFVGMGKDLYESSALAKELFEKANDILGYRITDLMFSGTDEDLRQTKVTQPAVFLHSVISALCMGEDCKPEMTAGLFRPRGSRCPDLRRWSEAGLCPCHGHAKGLRGPSVHYGCHHRPA